MTPLSARDRAMTRSAAALLLGYPDEDLLARRPLLAAAVAALPADPGEPLRRFLDHLDRAPLRELAAHYVETFDLRRRCCLYLTYYRHGDTRKRGMALLAIKHRYRACSLVPDDAELPDYLPMVLEYAATVGSDDLLVEHRDGLELLRLALHDAGSPYADVVDAVTATLPRLAASGLAAVRRLATEGPPREEVGLEPFGPPEVTGVGGRA